MSVKEIKWLDPREHIWGFHVHQELPRHEFDRSLVIQQGCANFLAHHQTRIDSDDALMPGYGPHCDYMWELRVESDEDVLAKLGLAISYMAINRCGLSAYIHPLMHDRKLSGEACLFAEGRLNQANILWFSYNVTQNQHFFIDPPRHADGSIVDTRTARVFSPENKQKLYQSGKEKMRDYPLKNPHEIIKNGYHIHMDYTSRQAELALQVFDELVNFLIHNDLSPTSTRIYLPRENGPHVLGGWEVKFEVDDTAILQQIGLVLGWLMCNRQELSIYVHPVTWGAGDVIEELKAHEDYAMFIGALPALDLNFFRDQIR